MSYAERLNNIYVLDTHMFGFEHYMSAYIVQGKEVVLVDTGFPAEMETLRAAIRAHGFDIADISRIFITHSHPDHSGNVGTILRENPRTTVYIHPLGVAQLVDPSIELEVRKKALPERMHAGIGTMEPVAPDRIRTIQDGDTFDLGDGEVLRAVYAPGHQPDSIIFYEAKNNGLFINDLVGNYFSDAGAHYALNPPNSDPRVQIVSLEKALATPVDHLYLGHYGIQDNAEEILRASIAKIERLLDIGAACVRAGEPDRIYKEVYQVIMVELLKLRAARGEAVYEYAANNHISSQANLFANYYLKHVAVAGA
jgi:glyoxylase-like metal-dependent hydrolase (beta-lactamase superfamily II)